MNEQLRATLWENNVKTDDPRSTPRISAHNRHNKSTNATFFSGKKLELEKKKVTRRIGGCQGRFSVLAGKPRNEVLIPAACMRGRAETLESNRRIGRKSILLVI